MRTQIGWKIHFGEDSSNLDFHNIYFWRERTPKSCFLSYKYAKSIVDQYVEYAFFGAKNRQNQLFSAINITNYC